MTALLYIISFLIFAAVMCIFLLTAWYTGHRIRLRQRLKMVESSGETETDARNRTFLERSREVVFGIVKRLGNIAKPGEEKRVSHLKKSFLQAGLSDKTTNAIVVFFGIKVLLAAAFPAILLILDVAVLTMQPFNFISLLVVSALAGFYLPNLWLSIRIASRKEQILRGFPDALDLMVICTEAGMGLDMAIARVGEETKLTYPALSDELKFLNLELRAGKNRHDALKDLAMRTGIQDIESFVVLVNQTDRFGTSVSRALRIQSESMRTKRSQKVEELAAKLPVKLLFPTILFIFPSLFLVLVGPALIQAFRTWTNT